jgi:serine/threonine protein phosphatase PrpC
VSEPGSASWQPAAVSTPGPTISFAFNLGKVPDQGEDSDPILRDGPDLGLIGVFDGMGGAGGTVYDTPDGPRSGAYLAARIARDVVEHRMLELLEPDWNLNGKTTAEDLHRAVQEALSDRLAELNAPTSSLRSRLLRALPTTMALTALQRTQSGGPAWACHVFWTGDSRAYVFESAGARQLSTDDLRDPGDAMANLRRDSVVSNVMSADTEFHVNHRRVELQAPFLLVCATDGCFGYVPSPMHFEHLVLSELQKARSTDAWSASLQAKIAVVTGDDAAMALLGVGADFAEFQAIFAPRVAELEQQFIVPLNELSDAVVKAERELQLLRRRELDEAAAAWNRYKTGYEHYLRRQSLPEEDTEEWVDGAESDEAAGPPVTAAEINGVEDSPPGPSPNQETSS